ncbi:MAG TPA: hypothetical protein PKK99_00230 [Bacteroidia bacterium]|nr:hypothetical protein [Bacteroidia bacterium]HNP97444.1 hypothetical protein [Bacteroidia bacterium]
MNLPVVVDVAISMVFVYLLFSILVSAISELLQHWTRERGYFLYDSLYKIFADRHNLNYALLLYGHPIIDSKKQGGKKYPSYIQSKAFAEALIDLIAQPALAGAIQQQNGQLFIAQLANADIRKPTNVHADFLEAVKGMNNSNLRILLASLAAQSESYEKLKENIILWYDDYMDTVSGWYKRKIIRRTQYIGLLVAFIFHVDTIFLVDKFWSNEILRSSVVLAAEKEVSNPELMREYSVLRDSAIDKENNAFKNINEIKKISEQLALPIGMKQYEIRLANKSTCNKLLELFLIMIGCTLTGFALAYGADYWFNILGKLINVRSAVKPPSGDPSKKEDKK